MEDWLDKYKCGELCYFDDLIMIVKKFYSVQTDQINQTDIYKKILEKAFLELPEYLFFNLKGLVYQFIHLNTKKAVKLYKKSFRIKNNSSSLVNIGVIYQEITKDYEKAIKYFNHALSVEPVDPKAHYYMGVIYDYGQGIPKDPKKANKFYKIASKLNERMATNDLAYHYDVVEKNHQKAINYYQIAIMLGSPDAAYNLGVLYEELKDIENAKIYYKMAIDLNEDIQSMLIYASLFKKSDPNKMIEILNRVICLNKPSSIKAILLLADHYDSINKLDDAIKIYEKGIEDYSSEESMAYLGFIFYKKMDYDNALKYYKMALKTLKEGSIYQMVLNNMAVVYLNQEKYSDAKKILEKLVKLCDPEAMINLGYLLRHHEKSSPEKYISLYLDAYFAGNIVGAYNLAIVYKEQSDLPLMFKYLMIAAKKKHPKFILMLNKYLIKYPLNEIMDELNLLICQNCGKNLRMTILECDHHICLQCWNVQQKCTKCLD